jgi:hypothetical protein
MSQIKKAHGLNKKILNPVAKQRKTPLDFCYVNHQNGSLVLPEYLEIKGWKPEDCGLANIAHMKNLYRLHHAKDKGYQGIARPDANDVCLSSIDKGEPYAALLYFNKEGYSVYCREYKEYWDWVGKRNEERYRNTQSHGKGYDAKNMMHTFRLLDMAIEIARDQRINVHRPNRVFLLDIKSGKFEYDELLKMAEAKQIEMDQAFANSQLPDSPDPALMEHLAVEIREQLYSVG